MCHYENSNIKSQVCIAFHGLPVAVYCLTPFESYGGWSHKGKETVLQFFQSGKLMFIQGMWTRKFSTYVKGLEAVFWPLAQDLCDCMFWYSSPSGGHEEKTEWKVMLKYVHLQSLGPAPLRKENASNRLLEIHSKCRGKNVL